MQPAPAYETVLLRDGRGTVTHELTLLNGAPEGEVKLFSNGRLQGRLSFHAGLQHGETVFYDAAGRVTMRAHYHEGKLHGESLFFDPEGKPVRRATYRSGFLDGPSIEYYPSGKPRQMSRYKDDLLEGEMLRLGEDGQITERIIYCLGAPAPVTPGRRKT